MVGLPPLRPAVRTAQVLPHTGGAVNVSKQKGTAWETAVVRYLNEQGFPVERRALTGKEDKGDIAGLPCWTLECKAERSIDLAGYMGEAAREAVNANTPNYAAVVKRRGKGVSEGYVVMPLAVFVKAVTGRRQD